MTNSHPDSVTPSAKAKGKRPAKTTLSVSLETTKHDQSTPAPPATTASTTKPGMQTRPKRVLPIRSRRGGPGVGSCDVDVMILETRKRRLENEPLIPGSTKFHLTTNSSLVPPATDDTPFDIELNTQAYGRYFDRPEVQKAYKEQQVIQTPEFSLLPEDAVVGGRFRPRGSDEEMADTSDAAYEKRHRKYETFEKRQRLREKEKLKHEQYKLKERIEQLRAMETSAFLSLPASSFSEPPGLVHEGEYGETETGISDLPGAHVNGAAAYNEAERRRQEMLEVAETLEERYRVLLPPDRKWAEKKEAERREKERLRRESAGSAEAEAEPSRAAERRVAAHEPEPEGEDEDEEDEEGEDEDEDEDELVSEEEEAHPPPHVSPRKHDSDGESEVDFEERDRARSKGLKIRLKVPPGLNLQKRAPGTPVKRKKMGKYGSWTPESLSASPTHRRGKPRGGDGRFLPKHKRHRADTDELSTGGPPVKRYKTATGSTKAHASPTAKTECLLLKAAERSAAIPTARKTQRHVLAFGVAVPDELVQIRDYEIPLWCWPDSGQSDDEDEPEDDSDMYWHGPNGYGPGTPAFGSREFWSDEAKDTKEDFPEITALDDD